MPENKKESEQSPKAEIERLLRVALEELHADEPDIGEIHCAITEALSLLEKMEETMAECHTSNIRLQERIWELEKMGGPPDRCSVCGHYFQFSDYDGWVCPDHPFAPYDEPPDEEDE